MTARFASQVALVTGAAQGIGRATAELLAGEGATVVLADLAADRVAAVAAELGAEGHGLDVRSQAEIHALVASVLARHGRLDVLVNNAGAAPLGPIDDLSLAVWREAMAVNLESAMLCTQAALGAMRGRRYGRIVNVSSGTVRLGLPGHAAYVAAKAGVIGFTRVLAREAGGDGITANVVMPGLIETPTTLAAPDADAFFAAHVEQQCVKRRGTPEDVAACIAYVASPQAGFVTGQTINVGGGHTFG